MSILFKYDNNVPDESYFIDRIDHLEQKFGHIIKPTITPDVEKPLDKSSSNLIKGIGIGFVISILLGTGLPNFIKTKDHETDRDVLSAPRVVSLIIVSCVVSVFVLNYISTSK